MILVTPKSNAHWYTPGGEASHTIIGANGDPRPTTLRDARKLGLLPSVTSILNVLSKPGLEAWKQEQAILAALTLPRNDGESSDDFARRVVLDMDVQVETAAKFGTAIHAAIDAVNLHGRAARFGVDVGPWMEYYSAWRDASIVRFIASEEVVVGAGYAGRYDLLAEHAEHGVVLVDYKTQKIKPGGKPNWYESWACQLAAYRAGARRKCHCLSLVIDSAKAAPPIERLWTDKELHDGLEIFLAAKTIWQRQRGYSPE